MTLISYFPTTFIGILFWKTVQAAEWTSSNLATIPLAVRSPYLNIWTNTTTDGKILDSTGADWSRDWNGDNTGTGWTGFVRVDGVPYRWQGSLGARGKSTNTTLTVPGSIRMSPTRTTFSATAGPILFNVTFLSPIEPSDWVKQSLPFSYVSITASSTNNEEHDVQFYNDFSGQMIAIDRSLEVKYHTTSTSKSIFQTMSGKDSTIFGDGLNNPADGTLYLAMPLSTGLTWQSGYCDVMRNGFAAKGTLPNTGDDDAHKMQDGDTWVCIGFAINLGSIRASSSPVLLAVGLVRDPSIQAPTATGPVSRIPFFRTKYDSYELVTDDFLGDFEEATSRAHDLDSKIMEDGTSISESYANLLAFASRPAFAALDFTVPEDAKAQQDFSHINVYMKDVGNSSRANAVDVLFSAFSAYLYMNATLVGRILEPLFSFQSLPTYHQNYSVADLGSSFPRISGNTAVNSVKLGLEASGSMLIMALAHARKSGDGTLCQRNYGLLRSWADYLAANALNQSFITSDGSVPTGDTNLALKAIIGVQAMSVINQFLEPQGAPPSDTSLYASKARNLMDQWKNMTMPTGYLRGTFDDSSSWSLLYNAYADKLLKTGLIDDDVYKALTDQYTKQMSGAPAYGFPYHSKVMQVRSDWTLLTAAVVSNTTVRDYMIDSVHKSAILPNSTQPWSTLYDANDATIISGQSSPGHGASFALLALNLPDQLIRLVSDTSPVRHNTARQSIVGPVAGGTIGGAILLALIIIGIVWYQRKRLALRRKDNDTFAVVPFDPRDTRHAASGSVPSSDPQIHRRSALLTPLGTSFWQESSTPSSHIQTSKTSTNVTRSVASSGQPTSELRDEVQQLRNILAVLRHNHEPSDDAPPGYYADHH